MSDNKIDVSVLRKMRTNIPGRWTTDAYYDEDTNGYCTLGHIALALGEETGEFDYVREEAMPYAQFIQEIVQEQYPEFKRADELLNIPYWNDAPGRTEDEVVAVMDKAIAKAEEIV